MWYVLAEILQGKDKVLPFLCPALKNVDKSPEFWLSIQGKSIAKNDLKHSRAVFNIAIRDLLTLVTCIS